MTIRLIVSFVAALSISWVVRPVFAVPILQLYLEGGTYDTETDTWVLTPEGSSSGVPFRLWAIGNVGGPGGMGPISDVRLAIAYSNDNLGLSITLTPSQTGGLGVGSFNGFTDPSVPFAPTLHTTVETRLGTVTTGPDGVVDNGSTPVLSTGKALPSHGIYGDGTVWREYALGDFTLTDSPIGDFIGSFPDSLTPDAGQINVYEVSALGFSGATLHFDLYNHVTAKNKAKFAPFSHDGDADSHIIPEPGAMTVWSVLLLIIGSGCGFSGRWRGRSATTVGQRRS